MLALLIVLGFGVGTSAGSGFLTFVFLDSERSRMSKIALWSKNAKFAMSRGMVISSEKKNTTVHQAEITIRNFIVTHLTFGQAIFNAHVMATITPYICVPLEILLPKTHLPSPTQILAWTLQYENLVTR